ncbi:hypothetical protein MMEU_5351 [Mycobacterium marinum str. Europe]|nr:hypothetical protein MMEU_5351 [Mycobacterium marinum str. Europe]
MRGSHPTIFHASALATAGQVHPKRPPTPSVTGRNAVAVTCDEAAARALIR